jgi:regulator of sigma E protease
MSDGVVTLVAFVVVLGVLVFVHELGHFLAAKWAGIQVFRFSIGIGPPIRRFTIERGGTEYSISWLPLGGYVKMASQEEMASDALEGRRPAVAVPPSRTFEAQPLWKRMVVILAGVTFNVLFAWVVFAGVLYRTGRPVLPITTVGRVADSALPVGAEGLTTLRPGDRIVAVSGEEVETWQELLQRIQDAPGDSVVIEVEGRDPVVLALHHDQLRERFEAAAALSPAVAPVIGRAVPGGPADRAGLEPGDTILAIDGEPIRYWWDLQHFVSSRPGVPLRLAVGGPRGRRELEVTPAAEIVQNGGPARTVGRLGVYQGSPESRFEPVSLGQALLEGGRTTVGTSTLIVRTVRGMLSGRVSAREVGGPILIGQEAGSAAREGVVAFLTFMAIISVNLAVINLLPIPVLDGGQLLFLLGEAVIRRPLPLKLRQRLTAVGLALIIMLMLLAFSNDIRRLLGW